MLDAVIISDAGKTSFSATNPLKLSIEGRTGNLQVVENYIKNEGIIDKAIKGNEVMNWESAPKLNGIYLYNVLKKHHFKVALVNGFYKDQEEFKDLLDLSPLSIIISTTFIFNKKSLYNIVADIRALAPDIKILVGGPFVYFCYLLQHRCREPGYFSGPDADDFLFLKVTDEPSADIYIVSLKGEKILCDALKLIKDNHPLEGLPNTARFENGAYHFSTRVDDLSGSDDVTIDWKTIPNSILKSGVLPMQASVGCPYQCAFCNFVKDRRLTYVKPIDSLIEEMMEVAQRGIKYIWFVDDNFRLGKGDIEDVCRRIIREELDLQWMTFIRASTLEKTDPHLLKRAGCIEVQLGLESADSRILKNMNKKASPELYSFVLKKLLSAGINCSCYFIFGFPGETAESAERTREFILNNQYPAFDGALSWSLFPFILSPLSPIYEPDTRQKYELVGYLEDWRHSTMNSVEARTEVRNTFLAIKDSGPIYRGDNLEFLKSMPSTKRKQFFAIRHQLSKLAMKKTILKKDIMESFSMFFQ